MGKDRSSEQRKDDSNRVRLIVRYPKELQNPKTTSDVDEILQRTVKKIGSIVRDR